MDGLNKTLSTESFKQKQFTEMTDGKANTQIVKNKAEKPVSGSFETCPKHLQAWRYKYQQRINSCQLIKSLEYLDKISFKGMLNEIDKLNIVCLNL